MRIRSQLLWALLVLSVISAVGWYLASSEGVTWATRTDRWDGWKPDVVRMRAAREQQPLPGYLHSEPVAWDEHFDVDGEKLLDGRFVKLDFSGVDIDKILKWENGRKLLLCYDEARGTSLLDPATGMRVLVRWISARHPIDDYIKSLNAESTYDMMSAGYEEQRLWCLEIDRSVREVLAMKYLTDEVRADFIRLTKARVEYCELQSGFGASAARTMYAGGTMAGPAGFAYTCSLYRQAYFELSALYDTYRCFEFEPTPEEAR